MLTKFTVKNFKGFKNQITLDLSNVCSYDFSEIAVKNNNVNKAIIYGFNGEGKSNLGLAILDIASNLTDWNKSKSKYFPYLNLESDSTYAEFHYEFSFEEGKVDYSYEKIGYEELRSEQLTIDGHVVVSYDYFKHKGYVNLKGCENLQIENKSNSMSRVKYIKSNAILDMDDHKNILFNRFMSFVNRMLFFYSLQGNGYVGFQYGTEAITNDIIHDNVKDFEMFLSGLGIKVKLDSKEVDGEKKLMMVYRSGNTRKRVPFFRVASAGMSSLSLLYYWYIKMNKASFVFMDEFDAFYHFELAYEIVRLISKLTSTQVIFTTHNTDLLTNDLLRPDCYYYLHDNKIKRLSSCTDKDLRKAHNLQKMFKAGAFNV